MSDSPLVARLLELTAANNITTGQDLLDLSQANLHVWEEVLELSDLTHLDEIELGRLNWSPRKNWVDMDKKGLPKYIEDIALAIIRGSGMPRERAIPIAINRVKRWAAGLDNVKPDTISKAIKALAEWEALKARAKARRLKKG